MIINIQDKTGSGELLVDVMKIICGDTSEQSMVDIMCHHAPYSPMLGFKKRKYVDINNRPLDHVNEQQYFILSDVFEFFNNNKERYDTIMCMDGIEHLSVNEGYILLEECKKVSDKQIIFTPLGEYMVGTDKNPDCHRSGWLPEMLPDWLAIVFTNFHPTLNIGAWFAVQCSKDEKERIFNQIKNKYNG